MSPASWQCEKERKKFPNNFRGCPKLHTRLQIIRDVSVGTAPITTVEMKMAQLNFAKVRGKILYIFLQNFVHIVGKLIRVFCVSISAFWRPFVKSHALIFKQFRDNATTKFSLHPSVFLMVNRAKKNKRYICSVTMLSLHFTPLPLSLSWSWILPLPSFPPSPSPPPLPLPFSGLFCVSASLWLWRIFSLLLGAYRTHRRVRGACLGGVILL